MFGFSPNEVIRNFLKIFKNFHHSLILIKFLGEEKKNKHIQVL